MGETEASRRGLQKGVGRGAGLRARSTPQPPAHGIGSTRLLNFTRIDQVIALSRVSFELCILLASPSLSLIFFFSYQPDTRLLNTEIYIHIYIYIKVWLACPGLVFGVGGGSG